MTQVRSANSFSFLIGNLHLTLEAMPGILLEPTPAWVPFLNACEQEPDGRVHIHYGVPEVLEGSAEVFRGLDEEGIRSIQQQQPELAGIAQETWSIRQNAGYKIIVIGDNKEFLVLEQAKKDCRIYFNSLYYDRAGPVPLLPHPLGPLFLHYLALANDGFLLHASGIYYQQTGRIFTGFSGSGKSTMAALWQGRGGRLIHDDRLLIRKINGEFRMFNTPMAVPAPSRMAPVNEIYLIRHDLSNNKSLLRGAVASARLMACCIQHSFSREQLDTLMKLTIQLCGQAKVFELGFVPQASAVDYLCQDEE